MVNGGMAASVSKSARMKIMPPIKAGMLKIRHIWLYFEMRRMGKFYAADCTSIFTQREPML